MTSSYPLHIMTASYSSVTELLMLATGADVTCHMWPWPVRHVPSRTLTGSMLRTDFWNWTGSHKYKTMHSRRHLNGNGVCRNTHLVDCVTCSNTDLVGYGNCGNVNTLAIRVSMATKTAQWLWYMWKNEKKTCWLLWYLWQQKILFCKVPVYAVGGWRCWRSFSGTVKPRDDWQMMADSCRSRSPEMTSPLWVNWS